MNNKMYTTKELLDKVNELSDFFQFLLNDAVVPNDLLKYEIPLAEKTNDLSRIEALIRMRVRGIISLFEGACFYFRHIAPEICLLWKREILEEFRNSNENNRLEMKEKIKVSLRFITYALGNTGRIDTESIYWQAVCKLINTRHNITHPKSIDDLRVSEEDLRNANMALIWLCESFYRVIEQPPPIDIDKLKKLVM